MTSKNASMLLLLMVISAGFIGVTTGDSDKIAVPANISESANASAAGNNAIDDLPSSSMVASTMSWSDKTTVSGKIRNFFKDFKYQSGFAF